MPSDTLRTSITDTSRPLRRRLVDVVSQQIIPTLEGHSLWQAFLAQPPFRLPKEVSVNYHPGKPLRIKDATSYPHNSVIHYWPSAMVHSAHYPYFGFVLNGTIDWRIGITNEMAKELKEKSIGNDYALFGIPKSTFFMVPPGVPYSCGQLNHWECKFPHANYEMFWMRFTPQGVLCHFSWTGHERLVRDTDYFIPDPHLLFAVNALIDEFDQRGQTTVNVTGSLLLFIFYRLLHELKSFEELRPGLARNIDEQNFAPGSTIELACRYIQAHLHEKIVLEKIAAQAFVSSGQLCRVFRDQKNTTVNQYITQIRLERACALLRGSSRPITNIAHSVGYSSNAYFCRLFVKHFGCPPLQFRQNHLHEYYNKSSNVIKSQKT